MQIALILGLIIAWGASVGGSFWYGTGVGKDAEIAKRTEIADAIVATRTVALEGAADAISKIKVTNTTVRGRTDTIIRNDPIYVACEHSPDGLRAVNEALTGRPPDTGTSGDRKLPGVNPVN